MTLKEKFENVEIMFENQIGSLAYDELCEASTECVKIVDDFAIGFSEWVIKRHFDNKEPKNTKQLLQIYKKEKGL